MTEANVITAEGLSALTAELEELEGPSRREIAERIKTAREWGDLKENSEYHDAKNDQSHLERKIATPPRADLALGDHRAAGRRQATDGVVSFGSTVVVADEAGAEQTWTLVSSHEAAPKEGRLSVESPVAKALTGRRAGDTATIALPGGARCGSSASPDQRESGQAAGSEQAAGPDQPARPEQAAAPAEAGGRASAGRRWGR